MYVKLLPCCHVCYCVIKKKPAQGTGNVETTTKLSTFKPIIVLRKHLQYEGNFSTQTVTNYVFLEVFSLR